MSSYRIYMYRYFDPKEGPGEIVQSVNLFIDPSSISND